MMREGLCILSRGATSRVIRKYGSWSIAQGMRHRMSCTPRSEVSHPQVCMARVSLNARYMCDCSAVSLTSAKGLLESSCMIQQAQGQ